MAQPPNKGRNPNRDDRDTQHDRQQIPSPSQSEIAQSRPPIGSQNDARNKRHWPRQDPPMFWVTFLAFLGVCAYTYVAMKQVEQTQEANRISREGIYVSNRPYLMFNGVSPINEINDKGEFFRYRIGPNWTNYGNSPADDVTFYVCDPKITNAAARPNLVCTISDKPYSVGPIGPKQETHVFGVTVNRTDYDDTYDGKKHIYIFGWAAYGDRLKPAEKHQTRFCEHITKSTTSSGVEGATAMGCLDSKWSCLDGGCYGDPMSP